MVQIIQHRQHDWVRPMMIVTGDDAAPAYRRLRLTVTRAERLGLVGVVCELDGRPINGLKGDHATREHYATKYGVTY